MGGRRREVGRRRWRSPDCRRARRFHRRCSGTRCRRSRDLSRFGSSSFSVPGASHRRLARRLGRKPRRRRGSPSERVRSVHGHHACGHVHRSQECDRQMHEVTTDTLAGEERGHCSVGRSTASRDVSEPRPDPRRHAGQQLVFLQPDELGEGERGEAIRLDVSAGPDVPEEVDLVHDRRVVTACDRGCIVDDDPAGSSSTTWTRRVCRLDHAKRDVRLAMPDVELLGETAIHDRPEARYGRRHLQVQTRRIDDVELESNGYIPAHRPIVPTTRPVRFVGAPAPRPPTTSPMLGRRRI